MSTTVHCFVIVLLAAFVVAPDGDDKADGSAASPWKTLQRAADSVRTGDSVTVREGHYVGFMLQRSGTADAPITFSAEKGVVIDRRNARTPDGINLEGASHVVVEGFGIDNSDESITRAGIRAVNNHHVVIRNNTVDRCGTWGVFSGFSDDILIENNRLSRSKAEHGVYVSNSADRPVIRGNTIWDNHACGIHMNGDKSMGGDGIISEALVEANVIHGNGRRGGSGINADGVQKSRFVNNLLYDNHASGISLYRIDGGGGSMGNVVVNNTIVVAADGRWAVNIMGGCTGNTIVHNILLNANAKRGSISIASDSLEGFASDGNVVVDRFTANEGARVLTLARWRTATGQDKSSQVATPQQLFVDPEKHDYRRVVATPAPHAGTTQPAWAP